jgi:radical SAM protein with 4Fe4S-binding SPASM domain
MRCTHCGSSAGNRRENELSTNEWMNVCRQLAELDCGSIIFTGGEPILRSDWYEIAQRVRDSNMTFSILSNGLSINEETVNRLRKLNPHAVAISIDGATPATHDTIRKVPGSFQKCKEALNLLQTAGVPTSVVTTVHKINYKELPQIRELLLKRGIAWQIQIGNPMGRFPKDLALSYEEFYAVAMFIASTRKQYSYKEMPITGAHCIGYHSSVLPNVTLSPWSGCHAGINVICIQSNGGIKGCLSLLDDFIEGNVRENQLADMWNNQDAFPYNRKFTIEDLNNDCKGCRYGKSCKGGCQSQSTSSTGKIHCDPYCLHLIEKGMMTHVIPW